MRERAIANRPRLAVPLLALSILGGCSMMNGNVKGNFSCRAPDGTCAPTSRIDDAAVALLLGETAETVRPADARCVGGRCGTATARVVSAPQRRSGEKVLRIMFPAYIDDLGRLHEASAIHAVVESGDWVPAGEGRPTQAAAADVPLQPRARAGLVGAALAAPAFSLGDTASGSDPNVPTPAQVEAARARKPVSADDVRTKVEAVLGSSKGAAAARAAPAEAGPSLAPSGSGGRDAVPVRGPSLPGAPEDE